MDFSAANTDLWGGIIQISILAVMILIANTLRLKIPFIRKTLVPTSVLAGFILLLLKEINLIPVNSEFFEMVTYHGIALGFISMSLRTNKNNGKKKTAKTAIKSGALIVSTYLVQGVFGLLVSISLFYTCMPHVFPASGILLAMGFGQGPGQANNVGTTYETLGFVGGQSYGLAIAAAGFICACVVGVIYLNIKKINRKEHSEISGSVTIDTFQDEDEIPISRSLDRFSVQVALVLCVYIITYFIINVVTSTLERFLPGVAKSISPLLWGFNFIIGTLIASLCKAIIKGLRKNQVMTRQYQNNYLLSRISGVAFDAMIISGIASINFDDISKLWLPFTITIILGGVTTFFYLKIMAKKLYPNYEEEAFLSMYGMLTGTISSGILLLREIDPDYETPAANNLISGSAFGIAFGAPLLILISLAAKSPLMSIIVLGLLVIYFIALFIICVKVPSDPNEDTTEKIHEIQ